MFEDLKRISIFAGHYGSGKTELAINYTLKLAEIKGKVAIVDLDIVNPYFRSREVKEELESKGIKVISPGGDLYHADVPALSPAILGVLQNPEYYVVVDVGGDEIGATALGRFKPNLPEDSYNMYFVVNSFRPFTKTAEGIIKILKEVEIASRLKATGLISNGNLSFETDKDVILEGYKATKEAAKIVDLPISFVGVRDELKNELPPFKEPELEVKLFLLPPWHESETITTDPNSIFNKCIK